MSKLDPFRFVRERLPGRGAPEPQEVLQPRATGLGTFGGVFTPSILTILGVIMYLRFGWVVGQVGLARTLIIVTLSTAITFLTALSICAIATDQRVRIGGAYYMISRSLGIETGGAVGIPLYFAQALSVSLYTIGFAESLVKVFPVLNERMVGLVTTVAVALLAIKSARAAIRAQYVIMAAIAISLVSLLFGQQLEPTEIDLWGSSRPDAAGFWVVFAVFFPAVTGIMAGVNMSGDLKDPTRSIPRGTLAAVGVGYVIYMGLPLLLTLRAAPATLIEDTLVMRRIAFWGDSILLGVWGATLSSAVGSILGAPRVLQALARDNVLPRSLRWLGKGSGKEDEPRLGTLITLGIALVAVYFGNLNLIAPILTMFFLTTYGVLNIAAGVEKLLGSPSFRPQFKVHWLLSLIGATGCVGVMFLVNATATVVAIVVVGGIFIWLERRELTTAWGDVRLGIWMAITRMGLLRVRGTVDPKNWRPHLLVLSGAPTRRWHLIDLASSFSHNRALVTVSTVLTDPSISSERQRKMETVLQEYLEKRGVRALLRLIAAPNAFEGAERLVEAYGLGSLVPNTILLGDSEDPSHHDRYCRMIRSFHGSRRNVVIVHDNPERGFGERKKIDVWWGGLKRNGGLMMTLSYLLRTSLRWRGAEVFLKMAVPEKEAARQAKPNLQRMIGQTRMGAQAEVIVSDGDSFADTLRKHSSEADVIFLGMKEPSDGSDYLKYYRHIRHLADAMPTTIFVLAAENLEFGEILI